MVGLLLRTAYQKLAFSLLPLIAIMQWYRMVFEESAESIRFHHLPV